MKISELFKKNIARPINGVVKADQLDPASTWQELDEFVVTKELDGHLRKFFERYCEAIDSPNDPNISGKIGVWVSGFFGSGKSHFIKVLSHLLDNEEHTHEGKTKRAVEFFNDKIADAMILGDIKRAVASDTDVILFNLNPQLSYDATEPAVASDTDVILFNIDSKASSSTGRDAILAVFLKVLNEKLGYSPDHAHIAHIAHMERYLEKKGKYGEFQNIYKMLTQTDWKDERDAYEFNRDEVIESLSKTLGQSQESCEKWVDTGESTFSLSIENFAKWTKEYLDKKGPHHRLIFLVDEVGQFIGSDTALMLNLQTITEQLGTVCNGRAWVVVTSQEDIDAVLGEMRTARENDFSKIQGRFKTRLSLSSANVDEVIQERLLRKDGDENGPVQSMLKALFHQKGDILKNQLSFRDVGTTYKTFKEVDDFVHTYPFAPYQFKLLQRIFESIRKAGATGLHLAQGERSLLDAFQHAAKTVSDQEVGVLVPVYMFYPSIESFLDTTVKRTIDHAKENDSLEPFDIHVLQVLFLIRYVDEMKGNVDNLVTLCLDEIDADRLALKKKIEESLARLEKDSLVSRSGDLYYFLTNEERDINQEIKKEIISSADEAKLLGDIIFQDVLKDQKKHRYSATKKDIPFNRVCDQHPIGRNTDGAMTFSVVSPLDDDFGQYSDQKCILSSSGDSGKAIVRLDDKEALGRELKTYLRTDKYIRTKDDSTSPPTTRRIHKDLAAENQQRRNLLPKQILPMQEAGDVVIIGDRPFPRAVTKQRKELEARIRKEGFQQFIEAIAYTWFNRFVAIRYMEVHGYLSHGYRVLSRQSAVGSRQSDDDTSTAHRPLPSAHYTPEILENAERVELPGLNRDEVVDLKLDGGKDEQLYQMLLLAQCNALHKAMPFLFESIKDGTELFLPDNLLHTDSLVRTLVNDIPEEQWENVEIIGWLYQFYISEKKDEVIGKVVKSEDIPAATQLFTPNWIVRYMPHNTLGRKWMATYPDSPLKQQMEFYIEPAEQTPDVQKRLAEITPDSLNPEELTLLDPACGSGHILVEAYDLFKAIYAERGYRARDIPKLVLTKNLFGLEIDDRAAQLASFALMMKARADDRSFLALDVPPNVVAMEESSDFDTQEISDALNSLPKANPATANLKNLFRLMELKGSVSPKC